MKYALIIGNDEYSDTKLAKLKTPAADSRELANILQNERIGGFNEVTSLLNQTESEVRRAVSAFLNNKKPEDLVLVYFSGHGVLDGRGRLFLALKDTQTNLLTASAIPSSFISDELDNCRSKRQILILDCCNSGAFARGAKAGDQKVMTEVTFEGNGFGRVVLAASDATQFAFEGDQIISQTELSLFTHFLLEGLRTGDADINSDGYVSLDEWYDYTYSQVLTSTPRQIPKKWSYQQQGDLIIAKNPFVISKPVALPPELVNLLASPYSSARSSAVKELGFLLNSTDMELAKLARATLEKLKDDDSMTVSKTAIEELSSRKIKFNDTSSVISKPTVAPLVKSVPPKKTYLGMGILAVSGILVIGVLIVFFLIILFIKNLGGGTATPQNTAIPHATLRPTIIQTTATPKPTLRSTPTIHSTPRATSTKASTDIIAVVKFKNTKLRNGPDLRFKPVGDLTDGAKCQLLGHYRSWYRVECSEVIGWLAVDWLDIPIDANLSTITELNSSDVLQFSPECKKYAC